MARTIVRGVLAQFRSPARRWFIQGDRLRDAGEWTQAAAAYEAGLRHQPGAFVYWVQYGHMLKESGEIEAAGGAYRKALSLRLGDPDLYVQLGHYDKLVGDNASATRDYRRAVELGSADFEAFKGADASFSTNGLAAARYLPSDRNRPFVVVRPGDVDALFCLLVGRRATSAERHQLLGAPLLAAANRLIQSQEFAHGVVEDEEALPHEGLGWPEWWLIMEFLPQSGLLAGSDETLDGNAICHLDADVFHDVASWEILWRAADERERTREIERSNDSRKALLEDLASSEELKLSRRQVRLDWSGSLADPLKLRSAANAAFVRVISQALEPHTVGEALKGAYLGELVSGFTSRREVAQNLLQTFGRDGVSLMPTPSQGPDWRGLLHELFSRGPLERMVVGRFGAGVRDTIEQLASGLDDLPVLRDGSLTVSLKSLMDPSRAGDVKLDRRGREIYAELISTLLARRAEP